MRPDFSIRPRGLSCALFLLGLGVAAAGGLTPAAGQAGGTHPPDPADVATLDGIMAAVYASISGPAGAPREWDRFRSLMLPGARLIPTGVRPDGGVTHQVLTPEEFITQSGPSLVQNGFFEDEIGRVVERFGPVVHLMSAYESRRSADDPEPFMRGVNSFQLLHDGDRWWVVTIFWANETDTNRIPDRFLEGR